MTFLQRLLGMTTPANDPTDDRWYALTADGGTTISGVYVDSETALKLSVVYACDRLLAETIASLPALVYERLADGGRKRATNHPLYDVLHTAPNEYMTPFEFFDFMQHCAQMRGSGYAKIIPGRRGFVDQLLPIHPDRVREIPLPGGKLRYQVRKDDGSYETLNDEDMLHLRGMSADGIKTVSVLTYARESLGGALSADRYGARFWRNGARPGGVLETDAKLDDGGYERVGDSWTAAHSGENQHRVAILEQGLKWHDVGMSNEDSQFLQTRTYNAEDACRWFRVPPHMIGLTSKVTSWGSGIEQLSIGFVTYTLLPWLVRWQQAISRDLILAPQKYFVEFLVDGLLRGDIATRYNAYAIGRTNGWLSVNEVRARENMNPIDGGDKYEGAQEAPAQLRPFGPPPAEPPTPPAPEPGEPAEDEGARAHYLALVHEAAGRVVRKEIAALRRVASRSPDASQWTHAVIEFFGDHARFVAQTMRIPDEKAQAYVGLRVLQAHAGPGVLDEWEDGGEYDLAALVLEAQHANS